MLGRYVHKHKHVDNREIDNHDVYANAGAIVMPMPMPMPENETKMKQSP